jgi:DNA polymerase (family 10)
MAMPVQNAEIVAMFDQTADLLEIKGENQFRVRAYHRAARTIEGLPQSVRNLLSAEKDLTELPGIGKDLAGKIADIVKTGHFKLLEQLKKILPGQLGDMAALPGLGPKRVKLLYDKLKVRTLDDLRRAIKTGRIALRSLANERDWKLNEYGLFSGKRRIAGATEEEVYKKLGLTYIPPELREDRGEIALAKANKLPHLVTVADMRGDLHVHSDWTDGTASIEAMAAAAQACGYEYMALTDHSRRVAMAHGLDPARVSRQIREVDKLNAKLKGFTILKGIEVDILKDGRLDLPDSILSRLDVVVASVHSFFDLAREAQTDRVVRAMENRHVSILGHPTGRLIGEREPYDIDMDHVISAAHDLGCYLEINAEPDRLDLNDIHAHAAKSKGVKVAVSTDAHSVNGFQYMRFGIDQARRGWLTADDVINTRSLVDLRKLLKR